MSDKFTIDSEFHGLIPPLASDELSQLEANLVAEGCRDPLVLWQEYDPKQSVARGLGVCKEERCKYGKDKRVPPVKSWVASDGVWQCPECGWGLLPIHDPLLLDGHNRNDICGRRNIQFKTVLIDLPDREAAREWIINNQLGRRNLTRDQWEYLLGVKYNRQKKAAHRPKKGDQNDPLKPEKTAESLAAEYGVSPATVKRAGKVAEILDAEPAEREAVIKKRKRIRVVKQDLAKKKRQAKRTKAAANAPPLNERIIIGDFRKHADKVPDGSVSLIFTDPPYDRKASAMLPDLAAFSASKLADGGSLVCYVGQTQLPAALDAFRKHLRYWWIIACVHAGRSTVMREYGINAGWKAVLWFVKGTRHDNTIMVSDVMSGGEEKQHHEWQQAESEALYWINKLCPEDGIVCDPFLGSGTTAVSAIRAGKEWIGFEIDESTAKAAQKRIG